MKSDSKPKPEVVTLDDSVMINETGDISVQEVAHEEIVGEELPGMVFLNITISSKKVLT